MADIFNLTDTWNNAGITFTAIKMNVTDTASNAASLLMDLQIGGASKFKVDKAGIGTFAAEGIFGGGIFSIGPTPIGSGLSLWSTGSRRLISSSGNIEFGIAGASAFAAVLGGLGFGTNLFTSLDLYLLRSGAKVFSLEGASSSGATLRTIATSPAQITADQDNYNPGGTSLFQLWNTDASRNVTGLTFTAAQVDGQRHEIHNVGSFDIVLKHQTTSTAANQFLNSTGADITLTPGQIADLVYDATTARWRVSKRN